MGPLPKLTDPVRVEKILELRYAALRGMRHARDEFRESVPLAEDYASTEEFEAAMDAWLSEEEIISQMIIRLDEDAGKLSEARDDLECARESQTCTST